MWRGEAGLTQRAPVFSSVLHWESSGSPNTSQQPIPSESDQRWRQSTEGAGQGQTKTFASVNSHVRLDTEQALYGFLTSHPLTLGSLMDTSGGSLFFISHRPVLRVCFADCQLVSVVQILTGARSSAKGRETFTISHHLSQFDKRLGSADHSWVVG